MAFSNYDSGNCNTFNTFNTFNITDSNIFQTTGTPHLPSSIPNQSSYQADMFASSSSPSLDSGNDFTSTRQGIYRREPLHNNVGFDALGDSLNFDYTSAACSAPAPFPAPAPTTAPAKYLSGLPDSDFNLVNTLTPFGATNTSLFPPAGGLQQEPIPPPAYPPPYQAFPPGLQQ
ncbi:hypothetical protein GJ744_000504 [Endocarpon pusillum]|uniref:Uncharacterized protein n=1 Tax=Endocarpon pusillum TaxID=364733 RepID=A0A8H7E2I6_9EURO|nr:hypothetical protein GJ744_000504 [Endocarpon pusillum]